MTVERNTRTLLQALGVGNFNITMMLRNMFMAPATTDPKSPQIMLLVGHIQDALNALGCGLARSGYLDQPTAAALDQYAGPGWERSTWADVVAKVLATGKSGRTMMLADAARLPTPPERTSLSGMPLGLPDVPGGLVTYGIGAYLLYRHLKRKR